MPSSTRHLTFTTLLILLLVTFTCAFPLPSLFSGSSGRRHRGISSTDEDWEEASRMYELHEGLRGWGYSIKKEGKHTRPDFHMGEGWV